MVGKTKILGVTIIRIKTDKGNFKNITMSVSWRTDKNNNVISFKRNEARIQLYE